MYSGRLVEISLLSSLSLFSSLSLSLSLFSSLSLSLHVDLSFFHQALSSHGVVCVWCVVCVVRMIENTIPRVEASFFLARKFCLSIITPRNSAERGQPFTQVSQVKSGSK